MSWKTALVIIAIVISVIIGVISVTPYQVSQFSDGVQLKIISSSVIPLNYDFLITGMAMSGSWEGPGYARIFLESEDEQYLVFDTRKIEGVLEFSMGTRFDFVCVDSCLTNPLKPKQLLVYLSAPGVLTIDRYHFTIPNHPTAFAICEGCSTVKTPTAPEHFMFVLALLLLVGIIGSHTLQHCCKPPIVRRMLAIVFLISFVLLGGVFGTSLVNPSSALVLNIQMVASVFAAFGVLTLLVIAGVELLSHRGHK